MNNILKKMKNVNMFTKLVGLVVIFSVASCDSCKKEEGGKDFLKVTLPTEVKAAGKIKVNLKAEGGDVAKLEEYSVKVTNVATFSDDNWKTAAGDADAKQVKIKEDGENLKKLTTVSDLKKDATKDFELEVEAPAGVNSAKFTISIMKGSEAVATAKDKVVSWTRKA